MARGEDSMERLVDNVFRMVAYAEKKMRETPGFRLVLPSHEGNNICFWYIPPCLQKETNGVLPDVQRLHKVCPMIKSKMMDEGRVMVNYQPLTCKKLPNFFRLVLTCVPPTTKDDIDYFSQEISRIGDQIEV